MQPPPYMAGLPHPAMEPSYAPWQKETLSHGHHFGFRQRGHAEQDPQRLYELVARLIWKKVALSIFLN